MAKRVNNISYKGIRHTPSLVSDADGHASDCVNLSPDGNDLKPMPMPVKKEGYTVTNGARLVFVHQGVGYENYVEVDVEHKRLYLKDEDGNLLYDGSWANGGDILAVESMGNTLVVSTTTGTEYLVYEVDNHAYKWLWQRPPMPVIEFHLDSDGDNNGEKNVYVSRSTSELLYNEEQIPISYTPGNNHFYVSYKYQSILLNELKGLIEKNIKQATEDCNFVFPFFIKYAYRMKTGDYIMQSPSILLLPSTNKCPHLCRTFISGDSSNKYLYGYIVHTPYSTLQYKIHEDVDLLNWNDIISSVDIFISDPIYNYYSELPNAEVDNDSLLSDGTTLMKHISYLNIDYGQSYSDGIIIDLFKDQTLYPIPSEAQGGYGTWLSYHIDSVNPEILNKRISDVSLFHKVASLDLSELTRMNNYEDLPIDNLSNLANLPTLPDDYNSHCAVSPSLLQVYNSRLNMANIRQKVFDGFVNAFQPQSSTHYYNYHTSGTLNRIRVANVYFKVKKNGTTYIVRNQPATFGNGAMLHYTTYLYYPDADCYEAVVYCEIGIVSPILRYITIPMKRHEYLNSSYWYDDMRCLGEYISTHIASSDQPQLSQDLWYSIPNRFMMSSVGNPWHFPVANQFDIGRREIRALSVNAENMDAPQYGQNPIYVFSADGIWTIAINADGTFNKLSYVSSDVLSEMKLIGRSPTASAQQATFFKTDRGIMAIIGSQVRDIGKAMHGRTYNALAKLKPTYSLLDGIETSGVESYWIDLIKKTSDNVPFASFAATSDLIYDYRNNRLLLLPYAQKTTYIYVYDIDNDFWSKMLPLEIDESANSPAQEEYNSREVRDITLYTEYTGMAMIGSDAVLQDENFNIWYVGGQLDENIDSEKKFGFYVSRPLRFGTDDMKTLTRIVHDYQTANNTEKIRMALYGSVDGNDFWQITKMRGKSYKFFIIVLYTHIFPSSRYAYTAFEWEARMTDKIR